MKSLACELTECTFNSYPLGPCFCQAKSEEEVFAEDSFGISEHCPILYGEFELPTRTQTEAET